MDNQELNRLESARDWLGLTEALEKAIAIDPEYAQAHLEGHAAGAHEDPLHQGGVLLQIPRPLHPTKEWAGDVLKGEIEIRRHHFVGGHLDEEALPNLPRMEVEQSQPLQTGDIGEKSQELGKPAWSIDIPPIGR